MEDDVKSDSANSAESETFCPDGAAGERYDPLGAASDNEMELRSFQELTSFEDNERIQDLEQEQEKLTGSLLALTSHFGQVQFRLKQIIDIGSTVSKDQWTDLLKQLEEFAFRGIPDISAESPKLSTDENQREKQMDMIGQLKTQLEDLEKYAFEAGDLQQPQTIMFEKQKIIIDELKKKLHLPIDELQLPHLSTDELKSAVGELMNPIKMKDNLVHQLKTQIVDLERFINFIQNEEIPENFLLEKTTNCDCSSEEHTKKILQRKCSKNKLLDANGQPVTNFEHKFERDQNWQNKQRPEPGLMPRMAQLFEMFTSFHMGGGAEGFRKNVLKKTPRGNHWGDIRAQFELDVEDICAHMTASNAPGSSSSSKSTKRSAAVERRHNSAILMNLVRKRMAISLRNLLQHGITRTRGAPSQSSSSGGGTASNMMVPFISCFGMPRAYDNNYGGYEDGTTTSSDESSVHAWDLILEYYYLQNGDKFNETPAVKLSQSFNLDLVSEACGSSAKQSLLSHIGNVISIHAPYKSSANAHFKSFVCAAMNSKMLCKWLKLICQQTTLINAYYESWSYMMQTGFRESFRTLDKLSAYQFQLPVDQAVRQFESINDVFM